MNKVIICKVGEMESLNFCFIIALQECISSRL